LAQGLHCPHAPDKPVYDDLRHEFRLGGALLLCFKRYAPNPMLVLRLFQAEGWPYKIFRPFGKEGGLRFPQRLKKAVTRLNERPETQTELILFHSCSVERAIWWERKIPPSGT
jgi:hypothetical protein